MVKIEESVDRICSLPDSILGHILSFLPTKVAVSTCISLSRSRWRDIFPFTNNLDFDGSLVKTPNDTSLFMDFVDRCVKLKKGTRIDKFSLKCRDAVDTSRVHSWIRAALCSNVRELDLCIGNRQLGKEYSCALTCNTLVVLKLGPGFSLNVTASVHFPCLKILHLESIRFERTDSSLIQRLVSSSPVLEDLSIVGCIMKSVPVLNLSYLDSNVRELDLCVGAFICNTLVVLKLGHGVSLNVTASVDLPCLKILHLESIRFERTESSIIQMLVSSSPVLEDLLIVGCIMKNVSVLNLSSPSLKRLDIDKPYEGHSYKLVLDMPSLLYLRFFVYERGHILKNLCSLREAHVNISYYWFQGHGLLEGLCNVESLYLSGQVQKFLSTTLNELEEQPLLKNMTRLVLTGRPYLEMSTLMRLLQCCPNIEEFVSGGSIYGGYDVPCCVPSRLKSIEVAMFYTWRAKVVESLEYFLTNANMLETIQIRLYSLLSYREACEELETLTELVKVPSRSKTCEINVFFNGERNILEVED